MNILIRMITKPQQHNKNINYFMRRIIIPFMKNISKNKIQVYNEFSLQFELGIFLRNKLSNTKVQFERNVEFFGLDKNNFIKKEIDISIFTQMKKPEIAIELKFPLNGEYPEQMYKFCEDISFVEQLKAKKFKKTFAIILVKDKNFIRSNNRHKINNIYKYFRKNKILEGRIYKPTGQYKGIKYVDIQGRYKIKWQGMNNYYFAIIEV